MWCLDLWSPYIPSCVYYSGVLLSRQQGDSLCVYTLWVFVLQKEQKPQCSLVSFACWLVSQSSIFNRESVIIVTWHTFSFRGNSIGFMINLTVRKETARRKFALRCIFSEHCSLLRSKYTGYGLGRNNQSILVSKQKEWRYEVLFQVCRYGAACFVHSDDKSTHQ